MWRSITDSARSAPPFASRCRFVDLPEVRAKGCVGEADSFGSHCRDATWGHLVASLADQADPSRRVWIDIFAVRQWPCAVPPLEPAVCPCYWRSG